jgi:four helix bundle protein
MSQNYRDLVVWQKAMDLVEMVYTATKQFPKEETYGLTSQIRRAAVSIPSNIAEGQGRKSSGDFARFLAIAYGSLREVETQILIAERLDYMDKQESQNLIALSSEVGRLLNGLSNSLQR